eukprot:1761604-Prymnesium_polylepis.1
MVMGLKALVLGAKIGRLAGLPIPTGDGLLESAEAGIASRVGTLVNILEGVCSEFEDEIEEAREYMMGDTVGLKEVAAYALDTEAVEEDRNESLEEKMKQVVTKSYGEIKTLLESEQINDPHLLQSGLVKAVCAKDGSFEWVKEEWKDLYELEGQILVGLGEEELARIRDKEQHTDETSRSVEPPPAMPKPSLSELRRASQNISFNKIVESSRSLNEDSESHRPNEERPQAPAASAQSVQATPAVQAQTASEATDTLTEGSHMSRAARVRRWGVAAVLAIALE